MLLPLNLDLPKAVDPRVEWKVWDSPRKPGEKIVVLTFIGRFAEGAVIGDWAKAAAPQIFGVLRGAPFYVLADFRRTTFLGPAAVEALKGVQGGVASQGMLGSFTISSAFTLIQQANHIAKDSGILNMSDKFKTRGERGVYMLEPDQRKHGRETEAIFEKHALAWFYDGVEPKVPYQVS